MPRLAELEIVWSPVLDDHVIDVAWSPDGAQLAAASVSGPVTVFDVATGGVLQQLAGHSHGALKVAWRPDGAALATSGQDGCARLWDTRTGAKTAELDAGGAWVEHLAWHPRGEQIATAAGRCLRRFAADGSSLGETERAPSTISALAWRPDGERLAMGRYGGVTLFREDGRSDETLEWKGSILSLAWSPDAGALAGGGQDCSVQFWFFAKGERLEMAGYEGKISELAWSRLQLATSGSPAVIVWDCSGRGPEGRRPIVLKHHEALLSSLAFQPRGGRLASAARDGSVALWDLARGRQPVAALAVNAEVSRLAWSPGETLLATGVADGRLLVLRSPL